MPPKVDTIKKKSVLAGISITPPLAGLRVCVCVCERERERERREQVSQRARERECVCVCEWWGNTLGENIK